MPLVRLEDRAMIARTPHDGKRRVENRQPECEDRHNEGNRRCTLDRTNHGDTRKDKAEEHAPRVAHKDACGVEVVVEEADGRPRKRRRYHRHERNALLHRHEEDRDGSNRGDTCREAIKSVDQIDRIRQSHDPEDRRGNRKKFEIDKVPERVCNEVDAHVKADDEHRCCEDLPEQLHLCRQITVVVNNTDGNNDRAADHEPDQAHHKLGCEFHKDELHQNRHHKRGIDPDASDARDGPCMHLACIGLVECTRTTCKGDDRRCQYECDTKCNHKC